MQLEAISENVRRPAPVRRIREAKEAKWETPVLVHSRMTVGESPVLASSERLVWLSPRTVKVLEDDARELGDDTRLHVTIVHAAPQADVERVRHYLDRFADRGIPVSVRRGMLRCA